MPKMMEKNGFSARIVINGNILNVKYCQDSLIYLRNYKRKDGNTFVLFVEKRNLLKIVKVLI
jgi:hypothetical protein